MGCSTAAGRAIGPQGLDLAGAVALGWSLQVDNCRLIIGLVWPPVLAALPVLALGVSFEVALLPAWGAYSVSVLELLQTR